MKKVVVGSKNPVKIACVQSAFEKAWPEENFIFEGVSAASDVKEQPWGDQETLQGAINRTHNAQQIIADAAYYVGIEGGIDVVEDEMDAFAWIVVSQQNYLSKARTATFYLPDTIKELVQEGMELGHADDKVFKRENSKQKDGAVGILTGGLINRSQYYEQAVVLALIPFIKSEYYLK